MSTVNSSTAIDWRCDVCHHVNEAAGTACSLCTRARKIALLALPQSQLQKLTQVHTFVEPPSAPVAAGLAQVERPRAQPLIASSWVDDNAALRANVPASNRLHPREDASAASASSIDTLLTEDDLQRLEEARSAIADVTSRASIHSRIDDAMRMADLRGHVSLLDIDWDRVADAQALETTFLKLAQRLVGMDTSHLQVRALLKAMQDVQPPRPGGKAKEVDAPPAVAQQAGHSAAVKHDAAMSGAAVKRPRMEEPTVEPPVVYAQTTTPIEIAPPPAPAPAAPPAAVLPAHVQVSAPTDPLLDDDILL